MDVVDGFVLGIYNYCDRWCEKCALTSRCRVFADSAAHSAAESPELKAVSDAATHPSDITTTPGWLEEMLAEIDESKIELLPDPPPLPVHYQEIVDRARSYCMRVWQWFKANGIEDVRDPDDPFAVVQWFSTLNAAKVYRAISGLAEFDGLREFPPDHEGSAKVALLGIDQSIVAWRDCVSIGRLSDNDAAEFLHELEWLRTQLESHVPQARRFVRPAFDEPDEMRRLEATDWA